MMKKSLSLLFALIPGAIAFAQTTAEKLESAVHIYNDMRDYEDNLKPGTVNIDNINKMKADIEKARPMLEDVLTSGSSDEAKAARYFKANFQYELGFVYGMMGRNADAYDVLSKIEADYDYFSSGQFPMTYKYDSKTYSITYENFAPTLAEYYTGMSEICANLSKNDPALHWARKSYNFSYTTDWYKYIAINKILEVKKKQDTWDKEVLDMALEQIRVLTKLDTSYQRTIKENKYPTQNLGYDRINTSLQKNPSFASGEYYRGTAAPLLVQLNDPDKAIEYYSSAISGGFADGNKSYLFTAAEYGLGFKTSSMSMLMAGVALDKIAAMGNSLSCSDWQRLSNDYSDAGDNGKASNARRKQNDCERQERKREHRSDIGFRIYGGIYPGPMLCRYKRYMDFGGVVNLMTNKVGIEVSYKLINRNHLFMEDLSFNSIDNGDYNGYWDGTRAHVALKFFPEKSSSSKSKLYMGPLFEYVHRDIEPFSGWVTDAATNMQVRYTTFYPVENSYSLFFNYGTFNWQKNFGMDAFFGLGASYYQFDGGEPAYGNKAYTLDNALVQNRKPTRFGPVIRAGITIGLTAGSK